MKRIAAKFFLLFLTWSISAWAAPGQSVGTLVPRQGAAALCFDALILEPALRITTFVAELEETSPASVSRDGAYLCVLGNRVDQDRLRELQTLLQRLPTAVAERARKRAVQQSVERRPDAVELRGTTAATALERTPNFWSHLPKDAMVLAASGAVSFAVIYVLPEDFSGWDRDVIGWETLWQGVTNKPVLDKDEWWVNYAVHPFIGMQTYLLQRNRGHGWLASFLFSTASSVAWEYAVESWAEPPSMQDLLATSTIGSVLGELGHVATKLMRRNGFNTFEKITVTIINPAYVIENGYR